ncbi:MAG: hypothetical protein HQL24_09945 [Candidatus Omnitrophica bacterium]|nr:hypothetical protein [Candidatus Omnitrophota bacterium]
MLNIRQGLILCGLCAFCCSCHAVEVASDNQVIGAAIAGWNGVKLENDGDEPVFVPAKVEKDVSVGEYKVIIESDKDDIFQRLKITKKGLPLFIKEGHRFFLGLEDDEDKENELVQPGKSITGDGQPSLVVSEWSGGAHCCYTYDTFSLGDSFKHLGTIDAGHGGGPFKDVDGDGALEFITYDWTFAYWNACFAGSPAPKLILKWKNGNYVPAMDLMRKPDIKEQEYRDLIKQIQDQRAADLEDLEKEKKDNKDFDPQNTGWYKDGAYLPPTAWEHILDLIYGGNAVKAKAFLADAWPKGMPGQNIFWNEFMEQFSDSPYCFAVQDYYGSTFPVVCNKQTDDFAGASFQQYIQRKAFQDMIKDSKDTVNNPEEGNGKPGKTCIGDTEDCS